MSNPPTLGKPIASRLTLKEAVGLARDYFRELYAEEDLENVLLEEVILQNNTTWLVTFGYDTPRERQVGSSVMGYRTELVRDYKTVELDASTGEPLGVKIRKV